MMESGEIHEAGLPMYLRGKGFSHWVVSKLAEDDKKLRLQFQLRYISFDVRISEQEWFWTMNT